MLPSLFSTLRNGLDGKDRYHSKLKHHPATLSSPQATPSSQVLVRNYAEKMV
jgi:hypothetical protein